MTAALETRVGTSVTIEGTARNAAGGAIVMTEDRTPVYLDGVGRWDHATTDTRVSATGTLRKHAGQPAMNDQGEAIHGVPDARFVLEQPSWTRIGG